LPAILYRTNSPQFFQIAQSVPKNKFDIRLFCFDTRIYKTSLKNKTLHGFGGTSFHIIERYIQETIREEKIKYPECVIVITDGHGTVVSPKYPNNWYIFLTKGGTPRYFEGVKNIFKLNKIWPSLSV